jgi:hypothetical protein
MATEHGLDDLDNRTVDELRGMARRLKVPRFSRLDKAELLKEIRSRRNQGATDWNDRDERYRPALWERVLAYIAAFVALGLVAFVVIRNEPFASAQIAAFLKTVLSLSVAILGATIPGFLHLNWTAGGMAIRAGGALALFLVTYLFSPEVLPLDAVGAARFHLRDADTGEPVFAPLTLHYQRSGHDVEVACARADCLVEGRQEEIRPVDVEGSGYELAPEQRKLDEGLILLQRKNPRTFRASITPAAPDEARELRKPSREEYLSLTRHEAPLEQGMLVVRNDTEYRIELVLMPWKPRGIESGTFSRRAVWLPPCAPHETRDYRIPERDSTTYYFLCGSILGQTAQYLAQGSFHDPEVPTVEIELAGAVDGRLAARMTRAQTSISEN